MYTILILLPILFLGCWLLQSWLRARASHAENELLLRHFDELEASWESQQAEFARQDREYRQLDQKARALQKQYQLPAEPNQPTSPIPSPKRRQGNTADSPQNQNATTDSEAANSPSKLPIDPGQADQPKDGWHALERTREGRVSRLTDSNSQSNTRKNSQASAQPTSAPSSVEPSTSPPETISISAIRPSIWSRALPLFTCLAKPLLLAAKFLAYPLRRFYWRTPISSPPLDHSASASNIAA